MSYQEQNACRVCGGSLNVVFDLGELYPSAFVEENAVGYEKAPLILVKCAECGLVQLGHTVELDSMYRQYYYRSGINASMLAALRDVVKCALERVELNPGDIVVDVGCNDGTTLSFYPDDVIKVGFEPALNIVDSTRQIADYFINNYFSADEYPLLIRAKIITSLAMFYDLPDPKRFVRDVASILAGDGIWIMQISDLCSMLKTNSVENPCHEHLEYYCTADILSLVDNAGLQVFRIEHNDVNSGSLRFYICWKNERVLESSVLRTLADEVEYFLSPQGSMEAFAERVGRARDTLVSWLKARKDDGTPIYGLAASTKGNTLLQYFGIDHTLIAAIGDVNPEKFGKFTIGTNIPITSEQDVLDKQPDYLIILSWHFLQFFLGILKPYMLAGGVVITPLPEPMAYYYAGGIESCPLSLLKV